MHIYVFGSVCRGDVSPGSDIDLLAIVQGHDDRFSPDDYSIYSYSRIQEIWTEGNPFAWHLAEESRLVYASDQTDFLKSLGRPSVYRNCRADCEKFYALFQEAWRSFEGGSASKIFDLSMVFLGIRNFATCFSLGALSRGDFSRSSALRIGDHSLSIPLEAYRILERARMLSTRAIGEIITDEEAQTAEAQFPAIDQWMNKLLGEIR
jgi:hypothetical protein